MTPVCTCGSGEFFPLKLKFEEGGFEHLLSFQPGYACERTVFDSNDQGGHGYHCVEVLFIVKKDGKAVQFLLFSGWYPGIDRYKETMPKPMPADLGYHSPTPQYEGQTLTHSECPYTGGHCYYDGSGLNAETPFRILVTKGESALWAYLREYYEELFSETKLLTE